MGIGVQALGLMRQMQEQGFLSRRQSVIELGSQAFAPDTNRASEAIREFFPEIPPQSISTPRDLYRALGFGTYVSIDLDGHDGALRYNLNLPLDETYQFRDTFDLVTNHGTTEHCFDQFRCFENVHKLTRTGGIMLHALPSQGYQNHAFFNYHPSFFLDLASANGYDVLGLHYNLGEELIPYTDNVLAERGILATDFLAIFAVLRKAVDRPFVIPFDGRYFMKERDGAFVPRTDVGSHGRVEENRFPLSAGLSAGPSPSLPIVEEGRDSRVRFVLPVWGKDFMDAFLAFGLRGMIESGALAAAPRDSSEYVIVTDPAGARRFGNSAMKERLSAIMPVRVLVAPASPGADAYALLTRNYNLALADAVPGDIYFFLTSDCFFSTEVFARSLERLKTQRVVLAPALRVVEESFQAEMMTRPDWKLSARELLQTALRHEHPLTEAFCIDNERDIRHPLPAQVLARVPGGYVGRWTVMHPLAIRIANPLVKIRKTVDWNYGALQIAGWSDVAVLDSIEDGMMVSTTPLSYHQGEPYWRGSAPARHVSNLKNWVNLWALEYHLAQITHPVRLLSDPAAPEAEVAAGEAKVAAVIGQFLDYVNSRRNLPRASYHDLPASALLRDAIDRREPLRQSKRSLARLKLSLRGRAEGLVRRALARFR
jgi:SAM-dependent methyltransferase